MNIHVDAPSSAARTLPDSALEKYSSAITLSDMEIFVFPELLYSLVLANALSPRLWAWREDDWFKDIHALKPYRRVLRLKQFIIDHYEFNLDLDTWGLTTKQKEIQRFRPWMDEATISRSNALFGYEGDKYYFDLDIRRHFGLDKYNTDDIPYWKTETLEAMDAFRLRPGYRLGAGECVSLSTLYAAALFVVCGIPLDAIYLMATPLHSQNYVMLNDGIITNNRRIMTKNMWFNGTEQTVKAQRALRHEQVTIVSHHTGHIHCVYPDATIEPRAYDAFKSHLSAYLTTPVDLEILANFLRQHSDLQTCFQFCRDCHGRSQWIEAEKVYAYEHTGPYKASDKTRDKLLDEIDMDLFYTEKLPGRICINVLDEFFRENKIDIAKPADVDKLKAALNTECTGACSVVERLIAFARLHPRFPDHGVTKHYSAGPAIPLTPDMSRRDMMDTLNDLRDRHPVADLAFYAQRDFHATDWRPFLIAALQRNPVCLAGSRDWSLDHVVATVSSWTGDSIYDEGRMAQPDEVWNYRRGDGAEKAILLLTILTARFPDLECRLIFRPGEAVLEHHELHAAFPSAKNMVGTVTVTPDAG
ncbi:MAG TPA: hypothetical protein PKE26_04125 [Kiritimatiellia bacterium]|nr:hypothetical protein [Kiritimatiellia bacterium]HMO98275.1 hypothetical protein [Kiritimatiellia bacterium]HMP96272.1 hypothetical protein [Kiritimatiellia bacterium]